ncbi:hypothetical protein [Paraburkholderia youngii]|uniref:hypothetical protein n=1 Tax=Paraburkholderia youngii TaxID=2782701 RepID=UPI003D25146E
MAKSQLRSHSRSEKTQAAQETVSAGKTVQHGSFAGRERSCRQEKDVNRLAADTRPSEHMQL